MSDSPDELIRTIGQAFVDAAPREWTEGKIVYRRAGKTAEYQETAVLPDGRVVGVDAGRGAAKAFKELRRLMYQPGKGTWFTAVCTLYPDGRTTFDFDFDNEPEWASPTVAGHYVEDVEQYPRDDEHTPDWLRQRLAEATKGN
ncbi:hypothetical protein ACFP6A_03590 [Quadrisphaera sp. GCM10027208]|uniref:hypothetical protein n=1 Tax=Quadrisphaera sp. GCM10027208 TaxID=3273423 RepID=UPI0036093FBF